MIRVEEIAAAKGYRIVDGKAINPKGRILKTAPDSHGYQRFNVTHDGKDRTCWVHKLVAFQKFGQAMYATKSQVRHLDNDHKNNLDDNIALGTQSQNINDVPLVIRKAIATKRNVKIHGAQRLAIQKLLDAGHSRREIAKLLGCASSSVWQQQQRTKQIKCGQ